MDADKPNPSLLFCGRDESVFFVADGKDRVLNTKPEISAMPVSSVLSRARMFLPELASANTKLTEELQQRPATEFDIENVDDAKPYIEMSISFLDCEEGNNAETPDKKPLVVPIAEEEEED